MNKRLLLWLGGIVSMILFFGVLRGNLVPLDRYYYWDNMRYLLSAIIQSEAALISIVLIVAAFRLEAFNNAIESDLSFIDKEANLVHAGAFVEKYYGALESHSRNSRIELLSYLKNKMPPEEEFKAKSSNHGAASRSRRLLVKHIDDGIKFNQKAEDLKRHAIHLLIGMFLAMIPASYAAVAVPDMDISIYHESLMLGLVFAGMIGMFVELAIFAKHYLINPRDEIAS